MGMGMEVGANILGVAASGSGLGRAWEWLSLVGQRQHCLVTPRAPSGHPASVPAPGTVWFCWERDSVYVCAGQSHFTSGSRCQPEPVGVCWVS